MALYKNIASQKLSVFAFSSLTGSAVTGDAAQISAQISLGGAESAATNDVHPTELDATDHPGVYLFDLTQAETNADLVILTAVSSTSNVVIRPVFALTTIKPDSEVSGGTINIYKDDGTTEVVTGVTDTDSFDSMSGIRLLKIALTDSWYATGHDYCVVLKGCTINGVTCNRTLFTFSIQNRTSVSGTVDANVVEWNGDTVATPTVAGVPEVDVTYVGGEAATTASTVDANVTAISGDSTAADNLEAACDGNTYNVGGGAVVAASVTAEVTADVTSWKGETAPAMTGDAFARLGEPDGASVSADVAAVKTVVDGTNTYVEVYFDPILAKLDTTMEADTGDLYKFTAAALADSPGSGSNLVIGPLVAVHDPANAMPEVVTLEMLAGETKIFALTVLDTDNKPVSLSGKTLRFVVQTKDVTPTGVFDVESTGITIGGTDNSIASVTITGATSTSKAGLYDWWLLSVITGGVEVLQRGTLRIMAGVVNVA